MKKIIFTNSANQKFDKYAEAHLGKRWDMDYNTDDFEKVGNIVGKFLFHSNANYLVIHNPALWINQILMDLDIISETVEFELYRIWFGNCECPSDYDFIITSDDDVEKSLDFIFSIGERDAIGINQIS